MSTYTQYRPLSLPELILRHPGEAIALCERLADEMDECGRFHEGETLRDLADSIVALEVAR